VVPTAKMDSVGGVVAEEVPVEASPCQQGSAVKGHLKVQNTTRESSNSDDERHGAGSETGRGLWGVLRQKVCGAGVGLGVAHGEQMALITKLNSVLLASRCTSVDVHNTS
jgi:hypothetical protein